MESRPSTYFLADPKTVGTIMLAIGLLAGIIIGVYLPSLLSPPQAGDSETVGRQNIPLNNSPSLGSPSAPVTIIEFSDFQCSFCAGFYNETFPQLKVEYIDTGKVRFIYRNFPITGIHAYAEIAAEAAKCAEDQGKFWEYHDLLFGYQQKWSSGNATDRFSHYASDLKLNMSEFNSCLTSSKYSSEIAKDLQDGRNAGVTGTPTFFINGIPVVGAQPYNVFKATIDSEIKRS